MSHQRGHRLFDRRLRPAAHFRDQAAQFDDLVVEGPEGMFVHGRPLSLLSVRSCYSSVAV